MNRRVLVFLLLTVVLSCVTPGFAHRVYAGESDSGQGLIDQACAVAAAHRTLVLVKFGAEWCPWCRDMKKVFQEPVMVDVLKHFELVELDVGKRSIVDGKKSYERHFDLMMKYARKAFIPQLFILDKKGRFVARLNPEDYERTAKPEGNDPARLAKILSRYRLPQKPSNKE
ncbi:MAG: thioredoxin family protein [Candidatus Ozemobacteraceae bacterium]